MATYYIDPNGSNSGLRNGSVGQEWLTLSYACTRVTTSGDTIHINSGDYDDDLICNLSVGVNISGDSGDIPNITTNYVAGSSNYAYIRLYSSSLTNGNQTISYIHINGNNLTSDRCIWIGYRYNVSIHHCTIENFAALGVHFRNEIGWLTPPVVYATGNRFYNNIVNNCASRSETDSALLRCDGQEDLEIYNNTFNQTQRSAGENGNILNISNTRDSKVYDNDFTKNDRDGSNWNFFSEIFEIKGGLEIYNNTYHGAATLDFGGWINTVIKGAYAFGTSIHDNTFESNSLLNVGSHIQYAINLEAGLESIYIYDNYIKNYEVGIQLLTKSNIGNQIHKDIYVYNNRIEHIAVSNDQYTPIGIKVESISSNTYTNSTDNLNICNNTLTGGSNYNFRGIACSVNGSWTNINIVNNIISSFDNYAISFSRQTYPVTEAASINGMHVHNNIFYNNGNDTIYIDPNVSVTNYTITPNYTTDPGLLGISNFHLSAGSNAIGAGSATYLLSEQDYDNITWDTPPSIGAYEYVTDVTTSIPTVTTTVITDISINTATGGGNVTHDGSTAVTIKGIVWSTHSNPVITDSSTNNGTGEGSYASYLTGLNSSTHYHVRAYAINAVGTGYGIDVSFNTLDIITTTSIPTVTTTVITDISINTATGGGNVTHDGSTAVTIKGIVWSTSQNPTTSNSSTNNGTGEGSYTSYLTGLNSSTHYHVRAYATNAVGTGYGIDVSFNTLMFEGSTSLIDGLMGYWKLDETTGDVLDSYGNNDSSLYSVTIRGTSGKIGTAYTFSALEDDYINFGSTCKPTLGISLIAWINPSTQINTWAGIITNYFNHGPGDQSGYNIFLDASTIVFELMNRTSINQIRSSTIISPNNWYFIVGTWDGATIRIYINNVSDTSEARTTPIGYETTSSLKFGSHSFPYDYTGVLDEVAVWNRALTISEISILYNSGNGLTYPFDEVSTSIPTVTTSSVTNIFTTSASCGGNVIHDGSAAITAKGVCWDTTSSPTVTDSSTINGTGEGTFTSAITGLNASTHYYVRAYAVNSVGIGYGNEVTFDSSQHLGIYYVNATSGNDSSTGTSEATAWKTISKVNSYFSNFNPGDSILFKRGDIFDGSLNITKSGSNDSPIIIGTYGYGENPIISGFTIITNWDSYNGTIYSKTINLDTSCYIIVTVDGINIPLGRYPTNTYNTINSYNGKTSLSDPSLNSLITNWTGAEVVIRVNNYMIERKIITSHDGSTLTYDELYYSPENGNGYFIQNDIRTLDTFGEWYYDANTQTFYMYFGVINPNTKTVKVSYITNGCIINGYNNILFDNLHISGYGDSGFYLRNAGHITIQNCDIDFCGEKGIYGKNIVGGDSSLCVFYGNYINEINNIAIDLDSQFRDFTISYNNISNIGLISGLAHDDAYGHAYRGISINNHLTTNYELIEYNNLNNIGYSGISTYGTNITINCNFVNNFCLLKQDGGGIYNYIELGDTDVCTNVTITNNIVLNGIGNYEGLPVGTDNLANGIYVDGFSRGVRVENNTAAECNPGSFFCNGNRDGIVRYNTFYNSYYNFYISDFWIPIDVHENLLVTNNIIFAKENNQFNALYTGVGDLSPTAILDYNHYANPLSEAHMFYWNTSDGIPAQNYWTLAQWSASIGQDIHSQQAPITCSSSNDILFYYNASTGVNKNVDLPVGKSYMDCSSLIYSGNITIEPWKSIILIYYTDISTSIPTVITTVITDISTNTATSGGNVTHDGSIAVTIKGVVWSTSENPTVVNSSTSNGTGEGSYVSYLTGLNPSTHYHVRAYATNSVGTAYGIDVSFNTTYINIPDVSITKKMITSSGRYVMSGSNFVKF